jgi:hypothetical protein
MIAMEVVHGAPELVTGIPVFLGTGKKASTP